MTINSVNSSSTYPTLPKSSFAERRASVLSIQTPPLASRFVSLSLESADEDQGDIRSAPILPTSPLIAPKLPKTSREYQHLETISNPSAQSLSIRKFAKSSVSASGVYLVAPGRSSNSTPIPPSDTTSTSANSGSDTERSITSTPIPDSLDLPPSIEEDQEQEDAFIFKPADEGINGNGAKPKQGIESTDQPMMECVARILSPSEIVPPTALLTINFSSEAKPEGNESDEENDIPEFQSDDLPNLGQMRTGSAQKFIRNTDSFEKMTSAEQTERIQKISMEEVHDVSILDIRAYNTDRHLGNVLIDKENHLHAIDHGCIATRKFKDPALFCWMEWPQAHQPYSKKKKDTILALDWEKTKQEILDSFPDFPKDSLETLRLSQFLLQEGVKRDLTPFQIGCLMTGKKEKEWHEVTFPGLMQLIYEKKIEKGFDQIVSSMLDSLLTQGKSQSISMKALTGIYDTCQSEAMKVIFDEDFKETLVSLLDSLAENMKALEAQATEKTPLSSIIYQFLKEKI